MSIKGAEIMREKKAKLEALLKGEPEKPVTNTPSSPWPPRRKIKNKKRYNWATYYSVNTRFKEDTSWRDGARGRKGKTKYRRD